MAWFGRRSPTSAVSEPAAPPRPAFAFELQRQHVAPFYLEMNRGPDPLLAAQLVESAGAIPVDQLVWLLDAGWRPRKVAAWFALVRDDAAFRIALERPLHATHDRATEAVVAFVLARRHGTSVLPQIGEYLAVNPDDAVMAAIAAWAGGAPADPRLDWHIAWAELIERTVGAS